MTNSWEKEGWRSAVLAQYSTFGTIAGLEIASLTIFASLLKSPLSLIVKILFTIISAILFVEVPLILYLINQERKVAFNAAIMNRFIKNEERYRNYLIWLMEFGWLFILILLLTIVWS